MFLQLDKGDIPLFLAPMAGITDLPFRSICKELGADILITEMISTRGIVYNDTKTNLLLTTNPKENPLGVQLFGNNPEFFSEAIEKIHKKDFDFININMGCPTPKIVKNGDGSALMKNLELSSEIIKATVKATTKPVTVKIRKGWDDNSINAEEFSSMAEQNGAAMVMIHGRTREMFYSGKADWNIIKRVKKRVGIPIIGNGDVFTPQNAKDILEETGCDGIMIGRGAMGNPWVFREIKHFLKTGEKLPSPSLREKKEVIFLHLDRALSFYGERLGILEMRKHLAWYIKGLPYSAPVKRALQQCKDVDHIKLIVEDYFTKLKSHSGEDYGTSP